MGTVAFIYTICCSQVVGASVDLSSQHTGHLFVLSDLVCQQLVLRSMFYRFRNSTRKKKSWNHESRKWWRGTSAWRGLSGWVTTVPISVSWIPSCGASPCGIKLGTAIEREVAPMLTAQVGMSSHWTEDVWLLIVKNAAIPILNSLSAEHDKTSWLSPQDFMCFAILV